MGLFDGTIKKFAIKLCTALEEQALKRAKGEAPGGLSQQGNALVAVALIDVATIIRQTMEAE